MGDRSLGGFKSFEPGGDFNTSDSATGKDPQFDVYTVDMFMHTAPLLLGLSSATLGLVSLRAESIATKVVAASGAVVTGTLALGAVFAGLKGDN